LGLVKNLVIYWISMMAEFVGFIYCVQNFSQTYAILIIHCFLCVIITFVSVKGTDKKNNSEVA